MENTARSFECGAPGRCGKSQVGIYEDPSAMDIWSNNSTTKTLHEMGIDGGFAQSPSHLSPDECCRGLLAQWNRVETPDLDKLVKNEQCGYNSKIDLSGWSTSPQGFIGEKISIPYHINSLIIESLWLCHINLHIILDISNYSKTINTNGWHPMNIHTKAATAAGFCWDPSRSVETTSQIVIRYPWDIPHVRWLNHVNHVEIRMIRQVEVMSTYPWFHWGFHTGGDQKEALEGILEACLRQSNSLSEPASYWY